MRITLTRALSTPLHLLPSNQLWILSPCRYAYCGVCRIWTWAHSTFVFFFFVYVFKMKGVLWPLSSIAFLIPVFVGIKIWLYIFHAAVCQANFNKIFSYFIVLNSVCLRYVAGPLTRKIYLISAGYKWSRCDYKSVRTVDNWHEYMGEYICRKLAVLLTSIFVKNQVKRNSIAGSFIEQFSPILDLKPCNNLLPFKAHLWVNLSRLAGYFQLCLVPDSNPRNDGPGRGAQI